MSDITFNFIGWICETEPNGTKHDKVWASFSIGDKHYAGWGKRGKAMSFKYYGQGWYARDDQRKVERQKRSKYKEVDAFQLFAIFPYFKDEVEQRFVYCTLANKIK